VGRIAIRPLLESEEEEARLSVVARSIPDMTGALGMEESIGSEERVQVKLLERMACYLNRMDQRLEELCRLQRGDSQAVPPLSSPLPLSLSAAGLSARVELPEPTGTLVELTLDLIDNALPLIPAVASVVRSPDGDGDDDASAKPQYTAFHFEEITEVDRERIFRFATRIQRESLRYRERRGA